MRLTDRRLARIVQRCQDLPGQELFQYLDEESTSQSISSADLNDYLREVSGSDFTAKDFRTWIGTVVCALALCAYEASPAQTPRKADISEAMRIVSLALGNTPAICKKCYVHPDILQAYTERALHPLPGFDGKAEPNQTLT